MKIQQEPIMEEQPQEPKLEVEDNMFEHVRNFEESHLFEFSMNSE